jgi:hypothetical protein
MLQNMKQAMLTIGLLLTALFSVHAQAPAGTTTTNDTGIRATTDQLAAKYTLNADQAKEMYTIQKRKQRNLNQIEALKTTDPKAYQNKVKSIQNGTLGSIRRILKTKEQVELYKKTQNDIRTQRAQKTKELLKIGKSKAEIELAVLDIYAE